MSIQTTQAGIAERIRGLLGGQDRGMIESAARRLGVSEVSLRLSIDRDEPHPTIDVIGAVIRLYGVDPSWLITGDYDASQHRAAMEEEASRTKVAIADLIAKSLTPVDTDRQPPPPPDGAHLRLEA